MELPETLRSERLVLRRPRPDDAAPLYREVTSVPDVSRYLTWRPHTSVDETAERLGFIDDEWASGASATWLMTVADDGDTPIGMFTVWPTDQGQELGYCLSPRWWGRGLMTEAVTTITDRLFERPETVRVWATVDVDNPASARVLHKAGFEREGLLRKLGVHPNISDEHRDCELYARVRG